MYYEKVFDISNISVGWSSVTYFTNIRQKLGYILPMPDYIYLFSQKLEHLIEPNIVYIYPKIIWVSKERVLDLVSKVKQELDWISKVKQA